MSDIFREVDEDLRRDKAERLFKRYGGLIGAAALLVVLGTAGYVGWKNWQQSQRADATAALAAAVDKAEQAPADAVTALSGYAAEAPAAMATLARLNAAALLAKQGKSSEAVAVYDGVAGDTKADAAYRDFATLMAALNQLDGGDPAALKMRLEPLTKETSPWRFSAREATALLSARTGDRDGARTLFQQLAEDTLAPAGVRSRAADLAALYGKS